MPTAAEFFTGVLVAMGIVSFITVLIGLRIMYVKERRARQIGHMYSSLGPRGVPTREEGDD